MKDDFLDIPVALGGLTGLEAALQRAYTETELMDGDNKYYCEKCKGQVTAKRVSPLCLHRKKPASCCVAKII